MQFRPWSGDDLKLNISDSINTINLMLRPNPTLPLACEDAADANNDGVVDMTDIASTIDYLFKNMLAPSASWFPACDVDPEDLTETPDALTCLSSTACQ